MVIVIAVTLPAVPPHERCLSVDTPEQQVTQCFHHSLTLNWWLWHGHEGSDSNRLENTSKHQTENTAIHHWRPLDTRGENKDGILQEHYSDEVTPELVGVFKKSCNNIKCILPEAVVSVTFWQTHCPGFTFCGWVHRQGWDLYKVTPRDDA